MRNPTHRGLPLLVALVLALFGATAAGGEGSGPPRSAEGRYLVVWRRGGDGRWRIELDMWHRPTG